jgi:hypothetical protein
MTIRHICVRVAALATTLCAFADAQATTKTYPAAVCVQSDANGTYGRYGGTVFNANTNAGPASVLDLICPLVRESSSITGAQLGAFARSTVSGVGCSVIAESATVGSPNITFQSNFKASTANNVNFQVASFPATTITGLYYYASCFIPAQEAGHNPSHLVELSVTEP